MLFDHIDTSRKFLLLGGTTHKRKLDRQAMSLKFFVAALQADYEGYLVERHVDEMLDLPAHLANAEDLLDGLSQKAVAKLLSSGLYKDDFINGAVIADYAGMDFVCADPRNRAFKKAYDDWKKAASVNRSNAEAVRRGTQLDDQLVDTILAQPGKVIVYYGAGHFGWQMPVERYIPREERVIVNLFTTMKERDAYPSEPLCAADAKDYVFATDELLELDYKPEGRPTTVRKSGRPAPR